MKSVEEALAKLERPYTDELMRILCDMRDALVANGADMTGKKVVAVCFADRTCSVQIESERADT